MTIDESNVENIKKLIGEFKTLTIKLQKDNQIKSKNLKDTNLDT